MSQSETRAAVYVRVSDKAELPILKNQQQAAVEYARDKGFVVEMSNIFSEVAKADKDRSVFDDLLHLASLRKGRPFDVVIFTSLSRMTRGGVEAAFHLLRKLEQFGVGWHFVEQPALNFDADTPPLARDIVLSVIAALDKDYRRRISAATSAAYRKRKALAESNPNYKMRWGRHPKDCDCTLHKEKGPTGDREAPRPEGKGRLYNSARGITSGRGGARRE